MFHMIKRNYKWIKYNLQLLNKYIITSYNNSKSYYLRDHLIRRQRPGLALDFQETFSQQHFFYKLLQTSHACLLRARPNGSAERPGKCVCVCVYASSKKRRAFIIHQELGSKQILTIIDSGNKKGKIARKLLVKSERAHLQTVVSTVLPSASSLFSLFLGVCTHSYGPHLAEQINLHSGLLQGNAEQDEKYGQGLCTAQGTTPFHQWPSQCFITAINLL